MDETLPGLGLHNAWKHFVQVLLASFTNFPFLLFTIFKDRTKRTNGKRYQKYSYDVEDV